MPIALLLQLALMAFKEAPTLFDEAQKLFSSIGQTVGGQQQLAQHAAMLSQLAAHAATAACDAPDHPAEAVIAGGGSMTPAAPDPVPATAPVAPAPVGVDAAGMPSMDPNAPPAPPAA